MKKLLKSVTAMAAMAAITGCIYYFFKNKSRDDETTDDFDDLDDFNDSGEFNEEEEEKVTDTEDERGYVTLKLHKEEESNEEQEA